VIVVGSVSTSVVGEASVTVVSAASSVAVVSAASVVSDDEVVSVVTVVPAVWAELAGSVVDAAGSVRGTSLDSVILPVAVSGEADTDPAAVVDVVESSRTVVLGVEAASLLQAASRSARAPRTERTAIGFDIDGHCTGPRSSWIGPDREAAERPQRPASGIRAPC
jgi:hypothetical protein